MEGAEGRLTFAVPLVAGGRDEDASDPFTASVFVVAADPGSGERPRSDADADVRAAYSVIST